jgi:hypothetical protein
MSAKGARPPKSFNAFSQASLIVIQLRLYYFSANLRKNAIFRWRGASQAIIFDGI